MPRDWGGGAAQQLFGNPQPFSSPVVPSTFALPPPPRGVKLPRPKRLLDGIKPLPDCPPPPPLIKFDLKCEYNGREMEILGPITGQRTGGCQFLEETNSELG